jgi:predicted ATP-grasp superfamily ATP-dependent carboligase
MLDETRNRIVAIPTADPDLYVLSSLKDSLDTRICVVAPNATMVAKLSEKQAFSRLAEALGLPVPRTRSPLRQDDLRATADNLTFPLIVKPSDPMSGPAQSKLRFLASTKAVRVDAPEELLRIGESFLEAGCPIVVQEYVPGDDNQHIDFHAYVCRDGTASATFTGRKHRIFPIHAGSGCFVQSEWINDACSIGLDAATKIGFAGLANMNFKRHSVTGQLMLLEINPRLSQWHILPTRCGVNFPFVAYADAIGLELDPAPAQKEGRHYLNFLKDFRAAMGYRREGVLSLARYCVSICHPLSITYQILNLRDPLPFIVCLTSGIFRLVNRTLTRTRQMVWR